MDGRGGIVGRMRPAAEASRGRHRGSILVETLVALVLVSLGLLLTAALLHVERDLRERAVAQREVLEVEEAVLELVRAGLLPLESRTVEAEELALLLSRPIRPLTLWIEVRRPKGDAVPGLWEVEVTARTVAARRLLTASLVTRVWRPDRA